MTNANPIEPAQSPVKQALDHAELVERVPALQCKAARAKFGERGEIILIFPRNNLVSAYGYELTSANARRERDSDLKRARKRRRAAQIDYRNRVEFRISPPVKWCDQRVGDEFVSLSAILEARAEAVFWRRIVKELEHHERIKQQNRVAIELAAGIVRRHPRRKPQMRSV